MLAKTSITKLYKDALRVVFGEPTKISPISVEYLEISTPKCKHRGLPFHILVQTKYLNPDEYVNKIL